MPTIDCFSKNPELLAKFKALLSSGMDEFQAAAQVISEAQKAIETKVTALKAKV